MTEWKVIDQYPNYEVNNQGQVRNRVTGRVLKSYDSVGYLTVSLMCDGQKDSVKVHRLVGKYFVDGYQDGLELDHINRDRYDNRADNLRWVTHSQNLRNTQKNRRVLNDTYGLEFDSMAAAAEWLVVNQLSKNMHSATSCLYACLKGKTKTCGKCEWRYE